MNYEFCSTIETARVKTAFVSSLSYFSGRAQSKSGGKEGRRGSAITLIRKKCPRKETERVREGQADIERRAFLPNSFRLIFAQGRICHYTRSLQRERNNPPLRNDGFIANFLLMTRNCHSPRPTMRMMNRRAI